VKPVSRQIKIEIVTVEQPNAQRTKEEFSNSTLEQIFATEVLGAIWRFRLVEEAFSKIDDLDFKRCCGKNAPPVLNRAA
jgi:hypothetical protein